MTYFAICSCNFVSNTSVDVCSAVGGMSPEKFQTDNKDAFECKTKMTKFIWRMEVANSVQLNFVGWSGWSQSPVWSRDRKICICSFALLAPRSERVVWSMFSHTVLNFTHVRHQMEFCDFHIPGTSTSRSYQEANDSFVLERAGRHQWNTHVNEAVVCVWVHFEMCTPKLCHR